MADTSLYLQLALEPGLGPVSIRRLLDHFGGIQTLMGAPESALRKVPGITSRHVLAILHARKTDPRPEREEADRAGVSILTQDDPLYPPSLLAVHSPPCVLYMKGHLSQADHRAMAMVGTRGASQYAMEQAGRFSGALAREGYCVISGMARGVDTASHMGALQAGGRTVAVLGCGLGVGMKRLFVDQGGRLAESIAAAGALVSEYPMAWPPSRQTFPRRNRIIAAWGLALLVIEAPLRSGSLITAHYAVEMGKTVYALPGRVDQSGTAGSHSLIREGAQLVTCPADILADLESMAPPADPSPRAPEIPLMPPPSPVPEILSEADQAIVQALAKDPLAIDQLVAVTGLAARDIASRLFFMEMRRAVRKMPGNIYQLATR